MVKNIGSPDRIARILFALIVGILYFTDQITGTAAIVLGLVGIILLLTAVVGTCPIYLAAKFSTKKAEKGA
jgi:hypothetical protein